MNIEQAKTVLEDLKTQQRAASDQFILLNGAVQGAEAVLAALQQEHLPEEEAEVKEVDGKNSANNKGNRKRST